MRGLMMDVPLTVTGIMRHAEQFHGDQQVVSITGDLPRHRYGYGSAFRRARQLANALARFNLTPGDRVATLAWNDFRHFELYYAVSCSGYVLHTVNPRLSPDQISWIINHAGSSCLFADPEFMPLLERIGPDLKQVRTIVLNTGPDHVPESSLRNTLCFETLISQESDRFQWPDLDEYQASSLCYTSGTTGDPKGVVYSHRSTVLHALSAAMPDVLAARAVDCVLPVVPMFHVNAWGVPYVIPMAGAGLALPGRKAGDPATLVDLINSESVTLALGVPTVWLALLRHLDSTGARLPSLRRAVVGGAACPPALIDAYRERHGIDVQHAWGMTETSPVGTYTAPRSSWSALSAEDRRNLRTKQGRPVFGLDMRIVDDQGMPLDRDGRQSGALQVRGPFVASGYLGLERSDAHTPDQWFDTGDVATLDADGTMQITDRAKDLIKSGGEWISSIALESVAMAHSGVAEAVAIAVPHEKWLERPLLVVVRKSGDSVNRDDLLAHVAAQVARWWVPDDVVFVDQLPHTATGKVSKRRLREEYRGYYGAGNSAVHWEPA